MTSDNVTEGEPGAYRSSLTPPPGHGPATPDPARGAEHSVVRLNQTSDPRTSVVLSAGADWRTRAVGQRRAQRGRVPDALAAGGEAQGIAAGPRGDSYGDQHQALGAGASRAQPGPGSRQRPARRRRLTRTASRRTSPREDHPWNHADTAWWCRPQRTTWTPAR